MSRGLTLPASAIILRERLFFYLEILVSDFFVEVCMYFRLHPGHRFSVSIPEFVDISDLLAAACLPTAQRATLEHYARAYENRARPVGQRWLVCPCIEQAGSTAALRDFARRFQCRPASFFELLAFAAGSYTRWRELQEQLGMLPGSIICLEEVLQIDSLWQHSAIVPNGRGCTLRFLGDNGTWCWPVGMSPLLVLCE